MEEKTTVTANKDNDLKFREGLRNPDKDKKSDNGLMNEAAGDTSNKIEYFTE